MASNGSLAECPYPFIAERAIGNNGGYLDGRWCHPLSIRDETISCCFPCPITDWKYSNDYTTDMVPWIALAVLILMLISALTYMVLPPSATQRHYLTSCPLMGFIFMSIAFIVPLGPAVEYCHDAITPNYWLSDTSCAFSGSLMHYGVWVLVIGCFFRSLSLYLQLCWDVEPGPKFRIISIVAIFGGSLALLGIALGVSGVSYQVGDMCYISYPHSIASFWGPLIALAFFSFLLQLFIMAYCIRGVLTSGGTGTARFSITLFKRPASRSSPGLPRAVVPPRQASARVGRILQLQWRAIAIACLVLLHVVYVAQAVLRYGDRGQYSDDEIQPWVECLIDSEGDQEACLEYAGRSGPNQATVIAALAILASAGFWGFVCTVRWSMVLAWLDWARNKKDILMEMEILPILRRSHHQQNNLERLSSNAYSLTGVSTSPHPTTTTLDPQDADRLYGTRKYNVPQQSFSVPARVFVHGTRTGTSTTCTGGGDVHTGRSNNSSGSSPDTENTLSSTTIPSHGYFDFKDFR